MSEAKVPIYSSGESRGRHTEIWQVIWGYFRKMG